MSETEQAITPADTSKDTKNKINRCTLVPYPKIVFFYPLMCVSIVCGLLQFFAQRAHGPTANSHIAGSIFIIVFFVNILVISFDFPGVKALALVLGVTAVVFLILYIDKALEVNILKGINALLNEIHKGLNASMTFYFLVASILFMMVFGGILVNWLWNRWTVEPNRLLHKHGLFGELTEYPVIDLQLDKRIDDVFEYVLLRSGTLIFRPNPTTNPIRLENVPRINSKERKIQKIIRELRVSSQ